MRELLYVLFTLTLIELAHAARALETERDSLMADGLALGIRQFEFGNSCWQKNREEAISWYEKAAMLGVVDAQVKLAECHHYGVGVTQDFARAAKLYDKAARLGSAAE